jgi:hypothetical protein
VTVWHYFGILKEFGLTCRSSSGNQKNSVTNKSRLLDEVQCYIMHTMAIETGLGLVLGLSDVWVHYKTHTFVISCIFFFTCEDSLFWTITGIHLEENGSPLRGFLSSRHWLWKQLCARLECWSFWRTPYQLLYIFFELNFNLPHP